MQTNNRKTKLLEQQSVLTKTLDQVYRVKVHKSFHLMIPFRIKVLTTADGIYTKTIIMRDRYEKANVQGHCNAAIIQAHQNGAIIQRSLV